MRIKFYEVRNQNLQRAYTLRTRFMRIPKGFGTPRFAFSRFASRYPLGRIARTRSKVKISYVVEVIQIIEALSL